MSATVKCPMLGEWMWPGSIYDREADGAEKVMGRAARIGMTDVFLLVKGLNGSVCYNRGCSAAQGISGSGYSAGGAGRRSCPGDPRPCVVCLYQ